MAVSNKQYTIIGAGIILVAAVFAFILWLRAHDAQIRQQEQQAQASQNMKAQQQAIDTLAASIKTISQQQQLDRSANDAKFDSMKTVMQQAINMATVMGMKQPPTVIQPGTNPSLPQGGLYLNPEQVQAAHDYEKKCENCEIDRKALTDTVAAKDGVIAGKDKQLADKDLTIKNLNRDLKRGFKARLEDCATRAAVGGTSGAVGAAMSASSPLNSKPVGKAAAIGAGIGIFSCLLKH